jgi:small acid-soluble spore protein I (minor)
MRHKHPPNGEIYTGSSPKGGLFVETLTLRQAIIQRVHDKNNEELKEVIQDSIGNAEATLPGIGVLFEIIWSHSSNDDQERMVATLHDHLSNQLG